MGLQQFVVQQFINHLGKSAKNHKGVQTAAYSQSLEPVSSIIGGNPQSRDGICEATSAKWVALHAQGSSFFTWIYGPNGKIDPRAVNELAMQQIAGENAPDQDRASEAYLFSQGLIRRTNTHFSGKGRDAFAVRSMTGGAGDVGRQLPTAMTAPRLITGYYVMIGIHGTGGGHCMAAYIGQDVCFFDPNFGEYWFADRADFVSWFHKSFWLPYRFGRVDAYFRLREYAMKASFVTQYRKIGRNYMGGK